MFFPKPSIVDLCQGTKARTNNGVDVDWDPCVGHWSNRGTVHVFQLVS